MVSLTLDRRTTSDDIFEQLFAEIISCRLVPGAKLSEVEVARSLDVSRQPVREAFIRLANVNLLEIRPQRATLVKKISLADVANARFVRLAVELEIARRACQLDQAPDWAALEECLALQKSAVDKGDVEAFNKLDVEFHMLICSAAGCDFANAIISECKVRVDRMCMLGLSKESRIKTLYADHETIFASIKAKDIATLEEAVRTHLARLDEVLDTITNDHGSFFET